MQSLATQTLRSRWLAFLVHASLWVILYLTIRNMGGRAPEFRESNSFSVPAQSLAAVAKLGNLFATNIVLGFSPDTSLRNPFYTVHFVPPPTPAPPPPPTTRKIPVTYLGFYTAADGPKHAVLKMPEGFLIARLGTPVATNTFVADATMQTLTLTNLAAQTNLVPLNTQKEIEVPIK
jgi:hypothetical protein